MKPSVNRGHVVDTLFVLALFILFAACAFSVIALGVDVYKSTVGNMNENYTQRTAVTYLTQKIRQNGGTASVGTMGDAPALILTDKAQGTTTTIYAYQGQLLELFAKEGAALTPGAGQKILDVADFTPQLADPGLLRLTLTGTDGVVQEAYIALNTAEGGAADATTP